MSEVLAAVLDAHLDAGGYALLMSATLGSTARHRWLGRAAAARLTDAIDAPLPRGEHVVADDRRRRERPAQGREHPDRA